MAFSPDELAQIRDVVRSELAPRRNGFDGFLTLVSRSLLAFIFIFLFVLALHVLVILGFTIWHLLHK